MNLYVNSYLHYSIFSSRYVSLSFYRRDRENERVCLSTVKVPMSFSMVTVIKNIQFTTEVITSLSKLEISHHAVISNYSVIRFSTSRWFFIHLRSDLVFPGGGLPLELQLKLFSTDKYSDIWGGAQTPSCSYWLHLNWFEIRSSAQ